MCVLYQSNSSRQLENPVFYTFCYSYYRNIFARVASHSISKRDTNSKYALRMLINFFNTLNAELSLICHLLALLEAHHLLHFGRIRVKLS
jgi:hypothetical protein